MEMITAENKANETKEKRMLSESEKKDFIRKYARYLDSYMKFGLAVLPEKRMPVLQLALDEGCYTNHAVIHIGLADAETDTEENLMRWTMFRLGHEMQHVLSTTQKAWDYGLDGGFRAVCEAFSKAVEKRPRIFRKPEDYPRFLEEMKSQGYHLSEYAIRQLVHFIMNSLEDGRIERIRCLKRPGFRNYVICCRGEDWEKTPVLPEMAEHLENPGTYLAIVLNQILTLSTMSIYQKDFTAVCSRDLHIHELIQKLIPHIRKGVASNTCRSCMEEAIQICRLLAVEIAEASRKTALEELLESLIRQFVRNQSFSADSRTEEIGEEGMVFLFEASDLETEEEKKISGNSQSFGRSGSPYEESRENRIQQIRETARQNSESEVVSSIRAGNLDKRKIPKQETTGNADAEEIDLREVNSMYDYEVHFEEEKRKYRAKERMPADLESRANVLKRKIQKIFRNREKPALRSQKSGRMDNGFLYKLAMNEMDVFCKKQKTEEFDGCCYILMDNSGSMGDGRYSKRDYCCQALSVIEHAFQDIMPVKITAFDSYGINSAHHYLIKNWEERIPLNGAYNFYLNESSGCGNKDGYSIRVAVRELLARAERKKLLFVLSDGLPSEYCHSDGEADVHSAVVQARKSGIEVAAIYFGDSLSETDPDVITFRAMYEKNCIISEPEEIIHELIRCLKRICFR